MLEKNRKLVRIGKHQLRIYDFKQDDREKRTYVQNALLNDGMHNDADQGVEREHAQISNAIGVVNRRRRIEDARGVVAQSDEDAGEWLRALFGVIREREGGRLVRRA